MEKIKENVPRLRFPEFTGEWSEQKLSEGVSDIGDGLHGTPAYNNDGKVYFVNGNNLVDGKIVINSETKTVDEDQQSIADKSLDDTTILMSINGTIGNLAYYCGEKLMLGKSAAYIKVSNYDKKFIYAYLQTPSAKSYFMDSLTGTTIKNLGLKAIREMPIVVPQNQKEQEKVGVVFGTLDTLIFNHQRKLDQMKEYKKGLLQKMFTKNGETVPEIRFPGFTGDWEQRKVKDVCSISTGRSNTQDKVDDGIYPFYVRSPIIERSNKYLYDEEAVLTVGDGVGTGKVFHYVNGKYDLHQRVYRLFDFVNDIDAKFFYQWFSEKFYARVMSMTAKTSVDSVRLEMIADMDMIVPSLSEQKKISALLNNIDNLITLHQRKLDQMKEYKKGLLQQMFV